jgi:hypothetical protein
MGDVNKPLYWVGSSKKDLMALPMPVRRFFGHARDFAQRGDQHGAARPLKGFGGAGVLEILEDDAGGLTERCTRSGSRRQFSFFTASRRKARAASPHRNRTWM